MTVPPLRVRHGEGRGAEHPELFDEPEGLGQPDPERYLTSLRYGKLEGRDPTVVALNARPNGADGVPVVH